MNLEALPHLHGLDRLNEDRTIFDVKFFPYAHPTAKPVFALVAGRDIFICTPNDTKVGPPFHRLKQIRDPNENSFLNSIAWSQNLLTGDPWLCAAGAGSRSIKVFNAVTGSLVRVISGHGGDVNDLVISPESPEVLASCSADCHIRLWSLNPAYHKQPCTAILSGKGHTQPILTLAFHASGRYLLSGGQDTMVCLWSVPEPSSEQIQRDAPRQVYYPLFATSQIHCDYVDCIQFHGDLILSRASGGSPNNKHADKDDEKRKRNDILLWKIVGFPSTSLDLVPPIPVNGELTRSAFGGRFQRLLTFEVVPATPFYMRFSLYNQAGSNPILAMGNELSKYSFWDLQQLEPGYKPREEGQQQQPIPKGPKRKRARPTAGETAFSTLGANLGREGSTASAASSAKGSLRSDPSSAAAPSELKFDIADPFKPLAAHKSIVIPKRINFACRQVAWSPCGKWCVAVGDYSMVTIFKR